MQPLHGWWPWPGQSELKDMFKYGKSLHLGTDGTWDTLFPHWTVMISLHACFPSCKFYWSPFIGHLLLITKTLAHRSTCKCLNVQGQVAVLCRTESIWASRNPKVEERKKKEWKATYGLSAAGLSLGCCQDHPSYHLTLQCQGIPSKELREQLRQHPRYSNNKNTSASSQVRISL